MATIKNLLERIERRLFLAAGLDVQIHAEDQIIEMLRGVYNQVFDDNWYADYSYHMTADLDGITGTIVPNISDRVLMYRDIHSVFFDEDEHPLPRVTTGVAVHRIRTRSVMPSGDPESVFKIIPIDETGPVHFWYRTRLAPSVWEDQKFDIDLGFDDEVLMFGVVYEFLLMDGSNPEATAEYKNKFMQRQKEMKKFEMQPMYNKRSLERDGPATRWE